MITLLCIVLILFLCFRGLVCWSHYADAVRLISNMKDRQSASWLVALYLTKSQWNLFWSFGKWTFDDFYPGLSARLK